MTSVSAVIITFNEERNIKRCLTSIEDVADEIIVVDSFSTDKTAEICRSFPAVRFFQREWQGYAATKNAANQLAQHPYILALDADECLSDRLKESVLKEKNQLQGAYRFARLNNYCGKWIRYCGWYPDYKIRLFPKETAFWKGDFVHEKIVVGENAVNTLEGDLLHYSYYTQAEHYSRVEKYSTLSAEEKFQKGEKGSLIKGFFSALGRFVKIFILKKGFLEGSTGFTIARISAFAAWLRQKKLISLHRERTQSHTA